MEKHQEGVWLHGCTVYITLSICVYRSRGVTFLGVCDEIVIFIKNLVKSFSTNKISPYPQLEFLTCANKNLPALFPPFKSKKSETSVLPNKYVLKKLARCYNIPNNSIIKCLTGSSRIIPL